MWNDEYENDQALSPLAGVGLFARGGDVHHDHDETAAAKFPKIRYCGGSGVFAILCGDEGSNPRVTGMRRMSFAYGREKSLPLVFNEDDMELIKEISVFVDESGSFEPDEQSSRYYLICLLMHDQAHDISEWIGNLESTFVLSGPTAGHCVHVGPLIRREGEYETMLREDRQMIFRRMMAFVRKADVSYHCFRIDKHFNDGDNAVHDKLLQDINRFLIEHSDLFNCFDKLKIY